jgi:hypothetical protein
MSISLKARKERFLAKLAKKPETVTMRLADGKIYEVPREFAAVDFQTNAPKDYTVRRRRCRFVVE